MKKGGLKGALKGPKAPPKPKDDGPPLILTPGTFFTNGATGIGKRGVDLNACYKGEYNAAGQRHGFGKYTYPNGFATYEGQYVNGEKQGQGRLTFKDGGWYEGTFVQDEISGHGTRRFANGSTFTGQFELGEMHGPGVLTLANGDRFEGTMDHNRMQGEGVYTFRNGDVYQGDFIDHQMTGRGVMQYASGDRYEGEWLCGLRHGQGECAYACGDHYAGCWQDGLFNGEGRLHLPAAGIVYEGIFLDGHPTQLPTKLNLSWLETADDIKARTAKKPPPKGGAPPEDPPPVLTNTLGTPLPTPFTIAAQLQVPLPPGTPPPSEPSKPATPPPKGAPPVPAGPPQPVITEKPGAGNKWETAEMERGRVVNLTLHSAPPKPCTPEQPIGVMLANTLLPDGTTTLRLLLLPALVPPPLPLMRLPDTQERVHALEVVLEGGQHTWQGLGVGHPLDFDALQAATQGSGVGFLVGSCRTGGVLVPGHCRVALPDAKAKNPLGDAKKK
uniref:MORN repeat-containing protein 5 n=1 Tax=Chlamydomonas leiostraca TaxID=1034604 RepID=A0A7S0WZ70_9CHLO|mmetsp:Transcript_34784/g.88110  ORF Transcript_34784/g.88110 Transcript_34784/m.88110 type:complete len:499 (+) Transcript_34784:192-1688(+)|eukprot:CAMPEP_0202862520 /NCGR_PEP_ID=MMETSP1391-20130828/3533_1 /ASSEMBLY_ACC=CAM_ASM_000867 /TAXON_ID=1034604 /ORGANISM="Chlamydomonas leiostraca, Strain SAG 11-49" /LENGTH=498 /DNA_ID=CAMNT_0049542069 /DNA_START=153 /DNA_END=1649 /DNA_ORIENTATION=-